MALSFDLKFGIKLVRVMILNLEQSTEKLPNMGSGHYRQRMATAFGLLLIEKIKARGLTRRSFGALVGRSNGNISNIIKGEGYSPPYQDMDDWADKLRLTGNERQRFLDLAAIARMPEEVQPRFVAIYEEHQRLKADYAALLREVRHDRRVADGG